jgi:hypothetical protein
MNNRIERREIVKVIGTATGPGQWTEMMVLATRSKRG